MDRTAVYSKLPPTPPPRFLWQFAGTHVYSSQSSVAQRGDNAIQRIRVNKIVQCFHCKESDPTDSLIHPSNNRDLGWERHCWVKYPTRHHIRRDPTRSRIQTFRPREQRTNCQAVANSVIAQKPAHTMVSTHSTLTFCCWRALSSLSFSCKVSWEDLTCSSKTDFSAALAASRATRLSLWTEYKNGWAKLKS